MLRTLLCLTIALSPVAAFAQDAAPEPPPGWTGSAELGFVATSGNSEARSLGLGGELKFEDGVWKNRARVRYVDVESEGEQTAESLDGLLRFAREINERVHVFGEGAYLRNRFAGIDHRVALATGLTWALLDTDVRTLDVSAGLGYTAEQRVEGADRDFATGVASMQFQHEFSERSSFENMTELNLNLERGEDWRGRNVSALVAGLTDLFSLKLAVDVRYQNEPVPGFRTTDTVTSAAVVAKF